MLVLSRKVGERIFIGKDIVLTIVDVDRGKVRIGISAPKEVKIFREELVHPPPPPDAGPAPTYRDVLGGGTNDRR